jgi:PAS domain S-box-containing protein
LRLVSPIFGSAAELLGHTVWEKFPEIVGTDVERLCREAMTTQKPGACEFFYEPLDLWLEIRAHPSPRALSIYATDITLRTHAEKALRESESRYRTLMERAGEGIFVCDFEGRHLMVNPAGCEMLGYELEEMLVRGTDDIYSTSGDLKVSQVMQSLKEGETVLLDAVMQHKDGSRIDVETSVTRLSNGLIQSIARDVTVRKAAEQQERRLAVRTQLLSETLAQLLAARDPDTVARELFPKVAEHLGVDAFFYFMVDEQAQVLRLRACAGITQNEIEQVSELQFGQAISGTAAQSRRPIVATDIQHLDEEMADLIRRFGFQAYACNPLIAGDRLLGTLSFSSRSRDSFEDEELEFLDAVAQHTAVALDRLRTTTELSVRTRTLEILNYIGSTLAGELDQEKLVQAVTDAGREVCGAQFGAFFHHGITPEGESYVLRSSSGASREAVEAFVLPRNAQILGPTFRGDGVIRATDLLTDPRYSRPDSHFAMPSRHVTVRSFLAAPVISQSGEVLGGLFFGHPDVNVFSEEAEHIVVGIAAQAAIAMDNARLYERVQKTADRLNLSLSAANLGDYTWDAASDQIVLSDRTAEIFGVRPGLDLTRSGLRELLHPDDRERSREALSRSIETRTDYDIEYRVRRPDGEECWVAAKGRPFYAGDGRILGMVGVVQDISERKRAEAVSEARRRVFYRLAEGASLQEILEVLTRSVELESLHRMKVSVLLLDETGTHLQHGAAPNLPAAYVEAINGCKIGPAVGSCGTAAFTKKPVYTADIETDPLWADYRHLALPHGLRACWSTPIFSSEGNVIGTFAIYYGQPQELHEADVRIVETAARTAAIAIERRRNERALLESEARQRQLLAGLPVACYTMDGDGVITFFNDAAVKLWGRVPEREQDLWCGSVAMATVDGRRLSLDEGPAAVALREKRSVRGVEAFILRPDGSRSWVVPYPEPLFDPAGNCIGVINVIVDVTEERHAKRLLQEAKETAEAASAAKDRFLAVLSHELRTPLTPVLMTVASLEMDAELPSDVREDMAMIRRNVELETKLIDDLLDLSRITSGKLRLRLQSVDLNEAVRQVCEICRPQILEKGIRLQCELDDGVGIVSADSARLQQVLWNVIKNAAKFTPEGGTIHVSTRASGSVMQVQVRDTGIGIEREMLSRVFEAFEQGAGITRQFGGLGLGLAISKALVDLHGGSIRVESEGAGKGTTFRIAIPSQVIASAGPAKDTQPEAKWETGQLRLLVVEDHADTARTLARLLRGAGFQVKTAGDVTTGVRLATAEPFDLLISDLGLPDGTGYDLLKRIVEHRPMKAIAMSGFGMDEDLRKSREAGFSEHLVKPVNVPELLQAVRRIGTPTSN